MEYTFKKDFGFFKANDVLTWNEDIDAFTMDVEEGNSFRSAMIDERTVEDLRLEGLLEANAEPEMIRSILLLNSLTLYLNNTKMITKK